MFAVKKQNPLSFRAWSDPDSIEPGEVYCDFIVTDSMVYDAAENTVRAANAGEVRSSMLLDVKRAINDISDQKIAAIFGKAARSSDLMIAQQNATARCVELVSVGANRTVAEQAEFDAINAIWARIKSIRNYSNSLYTLVAQNADPASVDITAGWPE